jgi:hypothetical protein
LCSVFGFGFSAFAQTEAFAVHFENVDVVREPVKDRASQALCSEGFCPFVEWQVGCDDDRAALVAVADHFEQTISEASNSKELN